MNSDKTVIALKWPARILLAVAWPFVVMLVLLVVAEPLIAAWPLVIAGKCEVES